MPFCKSDTLSGYKLTLAQLCSHHLNHFLLSYLLQMRNKKLLPLHHQICYPSGGKALPPPLPIRVIPQRAKPDSDLTKVTLMIPRVALIRCQITLISVDTNCSLHVWFAFPERLPEQCSESLYFCIQGTYPSDWHIIYPERTKGNNTIFNPLLDVLTWMKDILKWKYPK